VAENEISAVEDGIYIFIPSVSFFPTIFGILAAVEYIYSFQSFVMPKLIRWSSVVTPISGVYGRSFRRVRKTAESDPYLQRVFPFVCLHVHMKQLGSHWTEFHEILYLRISWKHLGKVQFY
jgi:hypothetical protein